MFHFRYLRHYIKKSDRWLVYPEKVKKEYSYVGELKKRALILRLQDPVGMRKNKTKSVDPRRTDDHLTTTEPKLTEELDSDKVLQIKTEKD